MIVILNMYINLIVKGDLYGNSTTLKQRQLSFKTHVLKNIVDFDEEEMHLPIPVFSFLKPTAGVHFILHLLLSLGSFDTEIDLMMHNSLRESFRYTKLIGSSDTEEDIFSNIRIIF